MSAARTDGDEGSEGVSVLSAGEENALQTVRELAAAIRLGARAADIESIAEAIGEAGGQCTRGGMETGGRFDCRLGGACFSLTAGTAGGQVEIEFAPQPQ